MIHFSQLKLITTRAGFVAEVGKAVEVSADVTADRAPEHTNVTKSKVKKKTTSLLQVLSAFVSAC